jgi:hypothetical protein
MHIRLWVRGFRDAIEQRGQIGWSTNVGEDDEYGSRQEALDRGLTAGERLARIIWR